MEAVSARTCLCGDPNYHKYTLTLGSDRVRAQTLALGCARARGQNDIEMNAYSTRQLDYTNNWSALLGIQSKKSELKQIPRENKNTLDSCALNYMYS